MPFWNRENARIQNLRFPRHITNLTANAGFGYSISMTFVFFDCDFGVFATGELRFRYVFGIELDVDGCGGMNGARVFEWHSYESVAPVLRSKVLISNPFIQISFLISTGPLFMPNFTSVANNKLYNFLFYSIVTINLLQTFAASGTNAIGLIVDVSHGTKITQKTFDELTDWCGCDFVCTHNMSHS